MSEILTGILQQFVKLFQQRDVGFGELEKVLASSDFGIGDFRDLTPLMDWMASCGLEVLQLLPLNELAPGETSPYQALSALAADPIYLAVDQMEDVVRCEDAQRTLDSPAVRREDAVATQVWAEWAPAVSDRAWSPSYPRRSRQSWNISRVQSSFRLSLRRAR